MNIKTLLITSDEKIIRNLKEFTNKYSELKLTIVSNPNSEKILKKKFDIIILDEAEYGDWLSFHQQIQNYNINNIFITILEKISLEDLKFGFKEGIYDIIKKDANINELLNIFEKGIETVKILKSTEKIHKYCQHAIKITIPSDVNLVNETVNQLIDTAKISGFIKDKNTESNLKLALTEAIVNAIVHGNKSDINKKVIIEAKIKLNNLEVSIEDDGKGFKLENIGDPLDEKNLLNTSGRGIYLIKTIMDEVLFEKNGRKIILVKKREESMG